MSNPRRVSFYSLLYFSDNLDSQNSPVANAQAKSKMYVGNAVLLSRTLYEHFGKKLRLVTNDKIKLEELLRAYPADQRPDVQQIEFSLNVPPNARFFSAHFKLDVLRYFATQPHGTVHALIDLDVMAIRQPTLQAADLLDSGELVTYDISASLIEEYGEAVVAKDLRNCGAAGLHRSWYGGEFICGSAEVFSRLVEEVTYAWPLYCKNLPALTHHGDEAVVSSAVNRLRDKGYSVHDAGLLRVIGRFWSGIPFYTQLSYRQHVAGVSLLHVPQDKSWLARSSRLRDVQTRSLLGSYQLYLLYRRARNIVVYLNRKLNTKKDAQ